MAKNAAQWVFEVLSNHNTNEGDSTGAAGELCKDWKGALHVVGKV